MKPFSYHNHTTFCDGKNTVEEMLLSAIDKGCDSFGFSSHSYTDFEDDDGTLFPCDIAAYISEIKRVKEVYKDKIAVFAGIEYDYFSPKYAIPENLDYIIGSVHFIKTYDGKYLSVDMDFPNIEKSIGKYFENDALTYCEEYYKLVYDVMNVTNCNIIGHFDLVTKFNERKHIIDTDDSRYKNAANYAIENLCRNGGIFEINTGAMSRNYRTSPYPSEELMNTIRECRGKITYSSDAHQKDNVIYGFDFAADYAKKCGFKSFMKLSKDGFYEEEL